MNAFVPGENTPRIPPAPPPIPAIIIPAIMYVGLEATTMTNAPTAATNSEISSSDRYPYLSPNNPRPIVRNTMKSIANYSAKIIAINILGGAGVGLVIPLLPLWLALTYSATAFDIGVIFTAVYLATALGSYLSSKVAHNMNMLNVAAYTRLFSGGLLFAMAFSPTLIITAILYLSRGILAGFGSPSRTAMNVKGVDSEDYGIATSVQGIATRTGQLSSGLSGYLMDYSLPLPIFVGGILQLASGISYKLLFSNRKKHA